MREYHKKICNICDNAFERNNYYFGKLMKAQDFEIEQSYFNRKRWLINRMVHGWGVVYGLDVKQIKDDLTKVSIEPGFAIDCCGREILVCEQKVISLKPEEADCSEENRTVQGEPTKYSICLRFKECKTERFPALYLSGSCDQKEKCQFNRINDWFEIKVVPFSKYDRTPFCPKKCGCPNNEESPDNKKLKGNQDSLDNKSLLHKCICDWLLKCPDYCDSQCVVLATVTLDNNYVIQDIDKYTERKLIYNNLLLYDLINCYHGDLPRVCNINWDHNRSYTWNDFQKFVTEGTKGLKVTFNKPMQLDTINKHTFQVAAITVEERTGYRLFRYIPADDISLNDDATEATFTFEQDWAGDEVGDSDERSAPHSGLADGAEIEITLRGSSIFSADGKALDGSFDGNVPSGTGTQGSDFVSWFSVESRYDNDKTTNKEGRR